VSVALLRSEFFTAELDGQPVGLFTLRNRQGGQVAVTNLGAKLMQWLVPDRHGQMGDVLLGYDSLEGVMAGHASMNAFIARYANRIAQARFTLDGQPVQLVANSGAHCVHGGPHGSRHRVFTAQRLSEQSLALHLSFADGEGGFPGTLALTVTYTLGDDHSLDIAWQARTTDKPTVFNATGHAFFNLTGDASQPITGHVLSVPASRVLQVDAQLIPTGQLRDVAGTPMDFRQPKPIGQDLHAADEQLAHGKGYDHFYVLDAAPGPDGLALAATLSEPISGRVLQVWTTEPGVQVFSGNHLGSAAGSADVGKGGRRMVQHGAVCLEPSGYPDAPNHANFPSTMLRPGEVRTGRIVYRSLTD